MTDKEKTYEARRDEAAQALGRGDAMAAFNLFRWALEYPGRVPEAQWREALTLLARIGEGVVGREWAQVVHEAAEAPNDPERLYSLGYQLIEQSLHGIAATMLARANRVEPGQEGIVSELVIALEGSGLYEEAVKCLRATGGLLEESEVLRYLLSFNALMTRDLVEPRRLLTGLRNTSNAQIREMAAQVEQMLRRADAVRGVMPLDEDDLRGWHFVTTGSVLLHLSPYGFDEGMRGRYAFLQDSVQSCALGVRRAAAAMRAMGLEPRRVFLLPERESEALGRAAGQMLGWPAQEWRMDEKGAGLIVAYDLANVDQGVLQSLLEHRPGQVLWAHAASWTEEPPFAADLTTLLYQTNVSPWGERLVVKPDRSGTVRSRAAEGTPAELARGVVEAGTQADDGEVVSGDVEGLLAIAGAARRLDAEAAAGALRSAGQRRRQRADSPVRSSRFI